jgi:lipopolysaccharide transport system ATP-binding protein
MSKPIIEAINVSKRYQLGAIGATRLVDDVNRLWHRLTKNKIESGKHKAEIKSAGEKTLKTEKLKLGNSADISASQNVSISGFKDAPASEFWALRDVSFEVQPGEIVGVIGRNGAGKSTLLKILSRITEPTGGEIIMRGRVASLLEVGTGFHGDLTGRENIFLNGAILGMNKPEIRGKLDEIIAFAEIAKFVDTPVKRYSSGMYMRLAFAVAAHMEPEILIVDEVLAVGDAEFQKKCLGKMQDVSRNGRTVLFVSHNMAAITRLCQKAFLLDRGSIVARGTADSVVNEYHHTGRGDKAAYIPDAATKPPGNDTITLSSVCVVGTDGSTGPNFGSGTGIDVEFVYQILKPVRGLRVGFHLLGSDGTIIFNAADTDSDEGESSARTRPPGVFVSRCHIPAGFLNHGQYSITVGSDTPGSLNFYCEYAVTFFVVPGGGAPARGDGRPGLICPNLKWEISNKS